MSNILELFFKSGGVPDMEDTPKYATLYVLPRKTSLAFQWGGEGAAG